MLTTCTEYKSVKNKTVLLIYVSCLIKSDHKHQFLFAYSTPTSVIAVSVYI